MDTVRTIESIPSDEFEKIVERFIEEAAAWDEALPVDTFFSAWNELASSNVAVPLEVTAAIVGGELLLETHPESPLTAQGNRIWLEDGQEVIVRLRQ